MSIDQSNEQQNGQERIAPVITITDVTKEKPVLKRRKVEIHKSIKPREAEKLLNVFNLLPPELVGHVAKVNFIARPSVPQEFRDGNPIYTSDKRPNESGARFVQGRGYGNGILEINRVIFDENPKILELIIFHEVGGHGILDGIYSLSQEQFSAVMSVWKTVFEYDPPLISKDKSGKSKHNVGKYGINDVPLEQEEFIANRMAEFLLKRTGKYGEGDVNF